MRIWIVSIDFHQLIAAFVIIVIDYIGCIPLPIFIDWVGGDSKQSPERHYQCYSAPIHGLVRGHVTTMELFPAKCHEQETLQKLWRQTRNSWLLPVKCWPLLHLIRGRLMLSLESQHLFSNLFCFVLLYNKTLNDWSLGEQWILFPSNLNVSLNFVLGNIEILKKQNALFCSGPVINNCFIQLY